MLKRILAPRGSQRGLSWTLALCLAGGSGLGMGGCKPNGSGTGTPDKPASGDVTGKGQPALVPNLDPNLDVAVTSGEFDTLGAARQGLEAALALPPPADGVDIPLPFPRVERHGDRFRVVLARGKFAAVKRLVEALAQAGHPASVLPAGQAGGDDVISLGIVCTAGDTVPLYEQKGPLGKVGLPREIARLRPGQVVVPAEQDDERGGKGDEDPEKPASSSDHTAERGFIVALQPQAGLVHGPDVLLPADCTPRDEDNDDGNGRLLLHGRLCLTTRFAGRKGQVPHADLLAVTPNYRHCVRFPNAGTFDGFDHSATGAQFAVEVTGAAAAKSAPTPPGTPAPVPAPAAVAAAPGATSSGAALEIYAVKDSGAITLRGQFPGLARPAYLGDHLIAAADERNEQAILIFEGLGRRDLRDTAPIPAPRTLWSFAAGASLRLVPKVPIYRPAAPTLHDGRVRVSFQQACRPDGEKRVRAAAKKDFVQCVMEVEVEVGLDGSKPERRCQLDNAEHALDEAIQIPCP